MQEENAKLKQREDGDRFKPTDPAKDIAAVLVGTFTPSKAEEIAKQMLVLLKARATTPSTKTSTKTLKVERQAKIEVEDLLEWDSIPSSRDGRRGWQAPINKGRSCMRIEEVEDEDERCLWRVLIVPEDEVISDRLPSRDQAEKSAERYYRRTYLKRGARA